jgi:hypothetical protein
MTLVTVLPAHPNYSLHLAGKNGLGGPNSNYASLTREGLTERLKTLLAFSSDEIQKVFVSLDGPDRKYSNWHQGDLG